MAQRILFFMGGEGMLVGLEDWC